MAVLASAIEEPQTRSNAIVQVAKGYAEISEFTVATTTGNRVPRGRIPNPFNDEWY